MSNELTDGQIKQAHEFLSEQIDVPAFFEKLAASGVQPRTEKEASQLYELGTILAQREAEEQQKQASAGESGNPFLDYALSRIAPQGQDQWKTDAYVKQAADNAVKNSDLCKTAALVFAHSVANENTNE